MPDTSPNPTTPPASGPTLPRVDLRALADTALAVARNPVEFFKARKGETGFVPALVFSEVAWLAYGALAFLGALLFHGGLLVAVQVLLQAAVGGIVAPFLGGLVVWGASLILGSKAPYEPSVRIAAYSSAVLPVAGVGALLPAWIGWLLSLAASAYGIYIAVMGAKVVNFDAPAQQTPTT